MEIQHDPAAHRFFVEVDGHTGYVEYMTGEGMIAITHTIVPPAIGGRGIAGQLVRAALDYARNHDLKVAPHCSYADAWMQRHPDYDVLRA